MTADTDSRVVLESPARTQILGLLMRGLLDNRLTDDALFARALRLRGDVQIRAGDMVLTLRFGDGPVRVVPYATDRPRASVRGSLRALLDIAGGHGFVLPVLTGRLRVAGNLFLLLRMLPLLTAGEAHPPRGNR